MTRWIITAIAVGAITALSAAPGCAATGVGDPCTPDDEYDATFQGFSVLDVSTESKSYVCLSRLCLVNHFQGRVTCPYGQTAPGVGPAGPAKDASGNQTPAAAVSSQDGCSVPGTSPGSAGSLISATNASVAGFGPGAVPAQVTGTGAGDRTSNKTVYCSCRCANIDGNTNDGANYCACPDNYTCTPLVTSIGANDDPELTGSYCVLNGTAYNAALVNTANVCDPTATASGAAGYCPIQY
jgi:hypothetical protein